MKQVGFLLSIFLLAATGVVYADTGEEAMSGHDVVSIGDGNEHMTICTEAGVAEDLSGDDLDAYVQECMESMSADQELSGGEES